MFWRLRVRPNLQQHVLVVRSNKMDSSQARWLGCFGVIVPRKRGSLFVISIAVLSVQSIYRPPSYSVALTWNEYIHCSFQTVDVDESSTYSTTIKYIALKRGLHRLLSIPSLVVSHSPCVPPEALVTRQRDQKDGQIEDDELVQN